MFIKLLMKRLIPIEYHRKIYLFLKNSLFGFKREYYSQYGEDVIIESIMKGKRNGFFVDVGAFHPQMYSNLFLMYKKYNWKGINIEPNPISIKRFYKNRPLDINLNLGVAKEKGELLYYMFEDPLLNTFSTDCLNQTLAKGIKNIAKRKVEVKPLRDIFKEQLTDKFVIDVMSVDVEYLDLEVLQSNDWERFSPKVLIVEDHQYEFDKVQSEIFMYVKNLGYKLHSKCCYTLIFVKN